MAGKRSDMLDIQEMLRCMRAGQSGRRIARAVDVSRNTVRSYRAWFLQQGLLASTQPLPTAEALHKKLGGTQAPAHTLSVLGADRDEIAAAVAVRLQISVAWRRFGERHPDIGVGYNTFRRFVRRHIEATAPAPVLRLETAPGEQAQVDFGYAGRLPPKAGEAARKTWVFVMTLSFSRHQYVELVQNQSVTTWLRLHRNAFEFFGGVPATVLLDNLKAGIVHASRTEPQAQRAYRDCAEHYDFIISACLPRTPQHKGKVERGIQYVKRSLLQGHSLTDLRAANAAARHWVMQVAGTRTHGTTHTQPWQLFEGCERRALRPLPDSPFEAVTYRKQKLPKDCHVICADAFYSAPHSLIGKDIVIAATDSTVRLYHAHALVATHVRLTQPGARSTHPLHLPQEARRYVVQDRAWCRARACDIGPHTEQLVDTMLTSRVDRLRGAQALLRLATTFGATRLELAAARAVSFGADDLRTVKNILVRKLDQPVPAVVTLSPRRPTFARCFHTLFNPAPPHNTHREAPWTRCTN